MRPAPPPRAPEFNPAVHAIIDPVAGLLGFRTRKTGAPTWRNKLPNGEVIFVRIQRRADAVDPYAGGRFLIEVEHARTARPYAALAGRATFEQLLTAAELERVVGYQRQVITSLPAPPNDWVSGYPELLRETYLSNFDPDKGSTVWDFWHRFLSIDHVRGWARLMASLLPAVTERAQRLAPGVMYMGSPIDLEADPLRPVDPVVLRQPPQEQPEQPPPDPAWRPVSRRKGANLACAICGRPIGPSDITTEKVGYEGISHFECYLREMGS